ncbi:MAG: hypothetical protein U1C04_15520 [Hydrogenophaga sp.]|uniref:hypothetical protein n=1 Tax=Hydrogenophaga sp. TaxID=1904254 RepID=UPI002ABC4A09|nr:hypothetical protein [Hydrogenophaga sp.]MDZ4282163.1 hypothetical protein [Hydrogenophaga sp.]
MDKELPLHWCGVYAQRDQNPKWQFEPSVFPELQTVSEALGAKDWWPVLSYLEIPHLALAGLAPRIALERGMTRLRILELATAEGH